MSDLKVSKAEVLELIDKCRDEMEVMRGRDGQLQRVIKDSAVSELFDAIWDLRS